MKILPLLFALALAGCAEAGAKALTDAAALHDAARAYVNEVHAARKQIRSKCWEMLIMEVNQLAAQGKSGEARARLRENYPPLVTVKIITTAIEDPASLSTEPFGCD